MSREHVKSNLATVENILQGTYSGLVDNGEVENWKWLGGQVVIILSSSLITSSLSHNDDRSVAEDAHVTSGMMVNYSQRSIVAGVIGHLPQEMLLP